MRHADVVCTAAIRPEEEGGLLYDTSIPSETTADGKQAAVVLAPVYFDRREGAPPSFLLILAREQRIPATESIL